MGFVSAGGASLQIGARAAMKGRLLTYWSEEPGFATLLGKRRVLPNSRAVRAVRGGGVVKGSLRQGFVGAPPPSSGETTYQSINQSINVYIYIYRYIFILCLVCVTYSCTYMHTYFEGA